MELVNILIHFGVLNEISSKTVENMTKKKSINVIKSNVIDVRVTRSCKRS